LKNGFENSEKKREKKNAFLSVFGPLLLAARQQRPSFPFPASPRAASGFCWAEPEPRLPAQTRERFPVFALCR
jgi:hypothetical protein